MCFRKIDEMLNTLRSLADKIGIPLLDLTMRLYVAYIFFASGWLKFERLLNDNWDVTVFIFEDFNLPGDPSVMAAFAMIGELVLPILLVLGLFGRFAAAGLLVMTAVIEVAAGHNTHHLLWAFLLTNTLLRGPGLLSVDTLLLKWLRK